MSEALITLSVIVIVGSIPLVRHLWNTPANAPAVTVAGAEERIANAEAAIDRYSTRWGASYAGTSDKEKTR